MTDLEKKLKRMDRILVDVDGEEIEVYNWATVQRSHRVRPGESEHFEPKISAGDAVGMEPDAITHWLAEWIYDEFQVDVEDQGIDVIDPTDDEVNVR